MYNFRIEVGNAQMMWCPNSIREEVQNVNDEGHGYRDRR